MDNTPANFNDPGSAQEAYNKKLQEVKRGNKKSISDAWEIALLNRLNLSPVDNERAKFEYEKHTDLLGDGILKYESDARQLAIIYNFPLETVDDNFAEGVNKKFNYNLKLIYEGKTEFEEETRELIENHNLSMDRFIRCISMGKRDEYEESINLGSEHAGYARLARQQAILYNQPLDRAQDNYNNTIEKLFQERTDMAGLGFEDSKSRAWEMLSNYSLDVGRLVDTLEASHEIYRE